MTSPLLIKLITQLSFCEYILVTEFDFISWVDDVLTSHAVISRWQRQPSIKFLLVYSLSKLTLFYKENVIFGVSDSSHPGSWKCFCHEFLISRKYTTFRILFAEKRNKVQKLFQRGEKIYYKMRQLPRPFSKVGKTLFKGGRKLNYFGVGHNNVLRKGFATNKNFGRFIKSSKAVEMKITLTWSLDHSKHLKSNEIVQ